MIFKVFDLGFSDFKQAWDFQKETRSAIKDNVLDSALILCQHYPVITLGRVANRKNILEERGIKVYEIERGGDVTYHGPGQLTVYTIFNLNYLKKDIHWFLRKLEDVIIVCLAEFGVMTQRHYGSTGVWVVEQKIASIGIAIKNWVTFHGLSINVKKDDLANFRLIKPCGMDIEMTAMEKVLDRTIEIDSVKESLIQKFAETFIKEEAMV